MTRLALSCALLRPLLSAIVLFTLYFAVPLDNGFTARTLIALGVCLCLVAGLVVVQYRAITHSPHPRLTAVGAVAVTIPAFVLSFAAVYFLMAQSAAESFTQPMTRLDSLYFTMTVFTTVGFGDIAARSERARAVTTVQMFADLVLIGLVVRVFFQAVGIASAGASDPGEAHCAPPDSDN